MLDLMLLARLDFDTRLFECSLPSSPTFSSSNAEKFSSFFISMEFGTSLFWSFPGLVEGYLRISI